MSGIYIHIPFCHAKCAYCDFYSLGSAKAAPRFLEALAREIPARLPELEGTVVNTVYFGGGTPSALAPEALASILNALPMQHAREVTIEVNPEDVDADNARAWLNAGFNRVSMGVQSLINSELKSVGRRHSAAAALEALKVLRRAGFNNISADLIYGLPGQTIKSWNYSLTTLIGAGIDHLSPYLLSYEEGTPLWRRLQRGVVEEASAETAAAMYSLLCHEAQKAGFEHYEISNFARPGLHSRHNSSYWDLTPYLGLGPGAHSLGADGIRRYHLPDLAQYLENPTATEQENETPEEKLNDLIIISLRTARGLDLEKIATPQRLQLLRRAQPYLDSGMLTLRDNILTIPPQHWLTSDAIMRTLIFA